MGVGPWTRWRHWNRLGLDRWVVSREVASLIGNLLCCECIWIGRVSSVWGAVRGDVGWLDGGGEGFEA